MTLGDAMSAPWRETTARNEIVARITDAIAALDASSPVRVGIDGVDAAGKTTLAHEIGVQLGQLGRPVVRASIDGFHRPRAARLARGANSPEGYYHDSFNLDALRAELLEPLGPSGSRRYRRAVFDVRTDLPVDAPVEEAPQNCVLVFDGVFLHRPELRPLWDFSVFVRADFAVTLQRALERDAELFGGVDATRQRYTDRTSPGSGCIWSGLNQSASRRWSLVTMIP